MPEVPSPSPSQRPSGKAKLPTEQLKSEWQGHKVSDLTKERPSGIGGLIQAIIDWFLSFLGKDKQLSQLELKQREIIVGMEALSKKPYLDKSVQLFASVNGSFRKQLNLLS